MSATRRSFLHRFALTTGGLAVPGLSAAATRVEIPGGPERLSILAAGIDPAGIHAFLDAAAAQKLELHSFILMRHGRIAAEGWWAPYRNDLRHTLYSLSKSFTSTAVGLLAGEGKLSVEDKVISFFPGLLPEKVSDHLAAVRVKDLLTMSVGHATDPTFEMIKSGNWLKAFLAWPVEHAPGSHFVYNSGATYTLSAIVQKLSGKSVLDFLQPRLFAPLGIEGATWETCPLGICTGGWGLSVPTSALAKFAQLYLQKGSWNGQQVIPAAWIAEASSKQVQQPLPEKPARTNESNDWLQGYGYQFWRCRHGAFRGDGAFGQLAIIMPEQDAVLAVTAELGNMQGELDTVWEHLIPAMKAAPLPPDPAAEEKLSLRLAGLTLPVPTGIAPPAPAAVRKSYQLEKHPLGLTGVEFTFTPESCTLRFMEGSQEHRIECGIGQWKSGQTALPGGPPRLVSGGAPKPGTRHAAAAAGAWRDEHTFVMQLRFTETPHHDSLTCIFKDDSVEVSFLSSIAAMSPKPSDPRPPLRGKAI